MSRILLHSAGASLDFNSAKWESIVYLTVPLVVFAFSSAGDGNHEQWNTKGVRAIPTPLHHVISLISSPPTREELINKINWCSGVLH